MRTLVMAVSIALGLAGVAAGTRPAPAVLVSDLDLSRTDLVLSVAQQRAVREALIHRLQALGQPTIADADVEAALAAATPGRCAAAPGPRAVLARAFPRAVIEPAEARRFDTLQLMLGGRVAHAPAGADAAALVAAAGTLGDGPMTIASWHPLPHAVIASPTAQALLLVDAASGAWGKGRAVADAQALLPGGLPACFDDGLYGRSGPLLVEIAPSGQVADCRPELRAEPAPRGWRCACEAIAARSYGPGGQRLARVTLAHDPGDHGDPGDRPGPRLRVRGPASRPGDELVDPGPSRLALERCLGGVALEQPMTATLVVGATGRVTEVTLGPGPLARPVRTCLERLLATAAFTCPRGRREHVVLTLVSG
jgi:hypothetical protein